VSGRFTQTRRIDFERWCKRGVGISSITIVSGVGLNLIVQFWLIKSDYLGESL
jgi:hypothetical protein